ncbi:hypothetical protein F951_01052 [Acinetobacter soli CIP 110264]|uniref:Uncharacterized protein n=1 Tax=Acinetobacter soli NIPH 2899 TaxID=1217677 RepID=A0ABN0JY82_9GAMM|nr:hypothetical protein F951_01052 [Acinetobacter soli CIP 110264]ENV60509.1 hypothetical protein F950_01591 [Acinetobacter soli NIPH 2899]
MIMYCDFRFYHTLFTLQKNEFLSWLNGDIV